MEENKFKAEHEFLKKHIPSWSNLKENEITFSHCPFGMSRSTHKVTVVGDQSETIQPKVVILRKFVQHQIQTSVSKDNFIFRIMSSVGLGPKLLAEDSNFRLEEYVQGRILKCEEINMKATRRHLAIQLGAIHRFVQLQISEEDEKNLKINRKECFITKLLDGDYIPHVKTNLTDYPKYNEDETKKVKEMQSGITDDEMNFVKRTIGAYKLVFSHNDIWVGNILVRDDASITYLDYEVMDFNFAGYDIGKLLLEVLYERDEKNPNYTFKDFKHFPNDEEVEDFLKYYFLTYYGNGRNISNVLDDNEFNNSWNELFDKYTKEEVTKMMNDLKVETEVGVMIAGYYSYVLGMRIGKNPEFGRMDFIKFAHDGFLAYQEWKRRILSHK